MREKARLVRVEHGRKITQETDSRFLLEYHRAILLALKEEGALNEAQCRYAEEKLKNRLQVQIHVTYKGGGAEERGEEL